MQLINKTTGEVAKISQFTLVNCKVAIYENGCNTPLKHYTYRIAPDLNANAASTLSIMDNLMKAIYNYLLTQDELSNFELDASDGDNWLFENRPVRLVMPRSLVLDCLAENNAIGQLFDALRLTVQEFIITGTNQMIVYLEELYDEHKALLETEPSILIQNK